MTHPNEPPNTYYLPDGYYIMSSNGTKQPVHLYQRTKNGPRVIAMLASHGGNIIPVTEVFPDVHFTPIPTAPKTQENTDASIEYGITLGTAAALSTNKQDTENATKEKWWVLAIGAVLGAVLGILIEVL